MALWVMAAIAGVVLLIAIVGWTQYIHAQMRRYGHIPVLWRWFSGALPHSVRDDKDRRYRAQFDPGSQHYHVKARMHRALIRSGFTLGLPILPLAIVFNIPLAWYIVIFIGAALTGEAMWKIWKAEKVRENRKTMRNVARASAPFANQPVRGKPGQWIRFHDDKRQVIKAKLPKNWNPSQQNRDRLRQVITETAGFHPGSEAKWHLEEDESHVIVINRKATPSHVKLEDILHDIENGSQDVVVLGLGRGGKPVYVSLAEDSPHFGLSIGSGGGKSQLARLVAAQVLHHGGNVLFLDPKRISHAWARDLPNVRYARTTEEIHDALLWLDKEVDRRTDVADAGSNVEGEVLANVGARTLVIAEELNELTSRLRIYWLEKRPPKAPKKSPAITALESALFMGRQVKVNILAVAQMMTALAAGSGAARENMGVRILGRYTKNNWKMLVPEFEMPFRSMRPGRVQVITHEVTECQVAFLTGMEARNLATSGLVREFPPDEIDVPADPEVVEGEVVEVDDQGSSPLAITSGNDHSEAKSRINERRKVTLMEAANELVPRNQKSLQNAVVRDKTFPDACGVRTYQQGRPAEYWADEIIAWHEKKEANPNV